MGWLQKRRDGKAAEKARKGEEHGKKERMKSRRRFLRKAALAAIGIGSGYVAWKVLTTPVEHKKSGLVVKKSVPIVLKPSFGPPPRPNCLDYRILGKPSISAKTVNQILVSHPENYSERQLQSVRVNGKIVKKWVNVFSLRGKASPLREKGNFIVGLCNQYQLDPAVVLSQFWVESRFGLQGAAVANKNPGNIRSRSGGFRKFDSWEDGVHAYFDLIANGSYYYNAGRFDAESIIPTYAPAADKNNPTAYIAEMHRLVNAWRKMEP